MKQCRMKRASVERWPTFRCFVTLHIDLKPDAKKKKKKKPERWLKLGGH